MRKTLYKYSSRYGYNTRDEPTSIPFDSCQALQNMTPNHPNPIPRDGSSKWGNIYGAWNGSGNVLHVFPYSSVNGNEMICISTDGAYTYIYSKKEGIASTDVLIYSSAELDFSSKDTNFLRVKRDVYISNGVDSVYILERTSSNGFYFRNANIARPSTPLDNLILYTVAGGVLTPNTFIGYAVTYVRRTDNDGNGNGGLDNNGNPQRQVFNNSTDVYHPGVAESPEVIYDRNDPLTSGERAVIVISPGFGTIMVVANNLDILDPQVTHLRIYRTLEYATEAEARGGEYRWYGDFPVQGPNDERISGNSIAVNESTPNDTMAGNFNFSLNIGMDPMPAGRTMTFSKGRVYVGGVQGGSDEFRGRYFYSIPPLDPDYPEKWFSMFLTGTSSITIGAALGEPTEISGWKDTDLEDDEYCIKVDVTRGGIVYINSVSVWYLADSDPETFEPEVIGRTEGSLFQNSFVHFKDMILYLSNHGPATILGRDISIFEQHTAGEVWPRLYDNKKGYFFTIDDPRDVKGYFVNENWILADNNKTVCMFMPENKSGIGPWTFVSAPTKNIRFGLGGVFNESELVVYPYNVPNTQFYKVLDEGSFNDDGENFVLHEKSKALYISEKDRETFGEAAELLLFVEFTDQGQLLLVLASDFFRHQEVWNYDDPAPGLLVPAGFNLFRLNISQIIPEGFLGQVFEISYFKTYSSPYRFISKGFSLENIIRRGKYSDFISGDVANLIAPVSGGMIIETGVSEFNYIETGIEDYEIIEGG